MKDNQLPPEIQSLLNPKCPPFDPNTCRTLHVENLHPQVTKDLINIFSSTGPIEECKLIREEKSSYTVVKYFDRRSAALAIVSLNGRQLIGLPMKVNWEYASSQRDNTSGHSTTQISGEQGR